MIFYESVLDGPEFGQKFINGWDNLIWFFVLLTHVWPFILLGLGLIIGIRIYRRKK